MTTFYIVRHGQTEWNKKQLVQGHKDSPLTLEGITQAKEIAEKFKDIHFDKVFSSDLLRAQRTAELIVAEKKVKIQTSKLLREQSYGEHEGTHRNEFLALFKNWDRLTEQEKHVYKISKTVESNEKAASRLLAFLREAALAYPGKTILIVCHGGIMRYLAIHLGYFTYESNKKIDNLGSIILDSDGIEFNLKDIQGIK